MKIAKLNRILRFEQQQQDELAQRLATEKMSLDQLISQLQQVEAKQESLLDDVGSNPRDLHARQNRMNWSTMLAEGKTRLLDQQTRLEATIDLIAEQLRNQRSRVKAIEKLISTTAASIALKQLNREQIELADNVNQKYTGIQS